MRIRFVAGVVLTLVSYAAVFLVSVLSFAGGRFGWVPACAAFAAAGGLSGWVAGRRWFAAGVIALGLVTGVLTAHIAPPTFDRLRHEIDAVAHDDWRLLSEDTSGNALCFDYCRLVVRQYQVAVEPRPIRRDRGDVSLNLEVEEAGDGMWHVTVYAEAG
jgi:hypothetical protein